MRDTGRVLGLVQAGGKGSRMDVLTRERAKPALPFGGTYQLVDFALSSLAHSGIPDVWVSVQYLAGSLDPHLAGGRPWDLDRTRGGFRRVVPQEGDGSAAEAGFSQGNADDLLRMLRDIEDFRADELVVMSADHVFGCHLEEVVALHRERGAECTVVVADVSRREASQNMTVTADASELVRSVATKPDRPSTGVVATEIFVYDAPVLVALLGELRAELAAAGELADGGLGDFGDHLVPRLVQRGKTWAAPIEGYWRDVGRPEAYLAAHRDLLAGRVDVFDDPGRPVLTRFPEHLPARVRAGGTVADSLVSPGAVVEGTVVRSIVGPGSRVGRGAHVEDSVLFGDVVVESGARVSTALVDESVRIGRGAVVGELESSRRTPDELIAMVGRASRIRRRARVPAGARLEPGSTA
jgi:glucose-1-phosphate adenylyltransferase